MNTTHKTKGIVLRTVKYGDTSIIATLYTELFGLQSYIVKGVRKADKHGNAKSSYFQPGAILDLIAYRNSLKTLQFVKEFQWSYLYNKVFFDVTRNAILMYMIELVSHSIKEEETHSELFDFFEHTFIQLDTADNEDIADFPLGFTLQFAKFLGFQLHGKYSAATPFLDLQDGSFTSEKPHHGYVLEDKLAEITSVVNQQQDIFLPPALRLNHIIRRELLKYYQQFFSLHLQNTSEMKSFRILQAIL